MKLNEIKLSFHDIEKKLIATFVFLAPIFYDHTINAGAATMRVTHENFYQMAGVVLFCLFLKNLWLSLSIILSVLLYFYHSYQGGLYVINLMTTAIIYLVVRENADEELIKRVFKILPILLGMQLVLMFLQMLNWDVFFNSRKDNAWGGMTEVVGFMGLKAIMGMFCAMLMPFVWFRSKLVSLLITVPVFISECSSALIALGASYLFLLWHYSRKLFYMATVVVVIGTGMYAYHDSENAGMFADRLSLWKIVLRDAIQRPFAGYGLDSFRSITAIKPFMYFKSVDTKLSGHGVPNGDGFKTNEVGIFKQGGNADPWDNAHNEYVQLVFEFGFIGATIAYFFFRKIIKDFRPNRYTIPMMAYFLTMLIMSVGQFPFHLARIAFLFPVMLGLYEYQIDKLKEQSDGEIGS